MYCNVENYHLDEKNINLALDLDHSTSDCLCTSCYNTNLSFLHHEGSIKECGVCCPLLQLCHVEILITLPIFSSCLEADDYVHACLTLLLILNSEPGKCRHGVTLGQSRTRVQQIYEAS